MIRVKVIYEELERGEARRHAFKSTVALVVKPWDFIAIRDKPDSPWRSNRAKEPLFAILNLLCSTAERGR